MLSKSEKSWIKSLKDKKTRYQKNEFVAEGSKIVSDILKEAPDKLKLLCCTELWATDHSAMVQKHSSQLRIVTETILDSVASLKSTQEVIAVFDFPDYNLQVLKQDSFVLYLEKIRDPGNLGTILRTADWMGISKVYGSPDCVDPFNNKCIQATMASIMRVEFIMKTWDEMKLLFPGAMYYAAVSDGMSITQCESGDVNFVCIGNEAKGLSDKVLTDCQNTLSIPGDHSLGAESLNAAVAASLIMAWKVFGKSAFN